MKPEVPEGVELMDEGWKPPEGIEMMPEGWTPEGDAPKPKASPLVGEPGLLDSAVAGAVNTTQFTDEAAGVARALASVGARMGLDLAGTQLGRKLMRSVMGMEDQPDEVVDATLNKAVGSRLLGAPTGGGGREVTAMPEGYGESAMAGYRRGRDDLRAIFSQAREAHPVANIAGEIAPMLAAGPIGGRTALGKVAAGTALGAGLGAGASEEDLTQGELLPFLQDVAVSGAIGGPVAGAVGAIGGKVAGGLRTLAEKNALRAMGVRAGIQNQLQRMGYATADEAKGLGRKALDMGMIPFGSSPEGVSELAQAAKEVVGAQKGQAIQEVSRMHGGDLPFRQIAAQLRKEVLGPLNKIEQLQAEPATTAINAIRQTGMGTLAELDDLKVALGKSYQPMATKLSNELVNKTYSKLSDIVDDQVEKIAGPGYREGFQAIKEKFGTLADIVKLSAPESTRDIGRKGALGMILGAAAGSTGGALSAAAGTGAGQLLQRHVLPRLPSSFARLQDLGASLVGFGAKRSMAPLAAMGAEAATGPGDASDAFVAGQLGGPK